MKRLLPLVLSFLAMACASAQTLGGNNTWTGTNTFNGPITVGDWAACGDSLTSGYEGVDDISAYPYLLQNLFGAPITNYGVGGTTSTQIAVKCGVPSQNAVYSQVALANGNLSACTSAPCSVTNVAFTLGYEPTANSSTGGGLIPETGTLGTVHGTTNLFALYQNGPAGWSITSGVATIGGSTGGLALVAGNAHNFAINDVVTITGTSATGCGSMPLNGPQKITAVGTGSISFSAGTCTGMGSGGVVAYYTFTPDLYSAA